MFDFVLRFFVFMSIEHISTRAYEKLRRVSRFFFFRSCGVSLLFKIKKKEIRKLKKGEKKKQTKKISTLPATFPDDVRARGC